jgi:hypothetical protein
MQAKLFLNTGPLSLPLPHFQTKNISVGHFLISDLKADAQGVVGYLPAASSYARPESCGFRPPMEVAIRLTTSHFTQKDCKTAIAWTS